MGKVKRVNSLLHVYDKVIQNLWLKELGGLITQDLTNTKP